MSIPCSIRCYHCGNTVGRYAKFFDAAREAQNKKMFGKGGKYSGYDPDKVELNPDMIPPLEPIFDALGVELRCCRMHLMTRVDFSKWAR